MVLRHLSTLLSEVEISTLRRRCLRRCNEADVAIPYQIRKGAEAMWREKTTAKPRQHLESVLRNRSWRYRVSRVFTTPSSCNDTSAMPRENRITASY